MHQERDNKHADGDVVKDGAVPAYLLDRQNVSRAKVRHWCESEARKMLPGFASHFGQQSPFGK